MAAPSSGPGPLAKAFVATSVAIVVLVLVQAAMAGQSLFGDLSIELHGYVGNLSFAVGLVAAVLAGLGRLPKSLIALSGLLLLTLFVQVGLGYVGRSSAAAAAWHVPLGVATFGLAVATMVVAIILLLRPAPITTRT